MEIRIDCELLNEQIELCDNCAGVLNSRFSEQFDGIADLLSEICYALENGIELHIVKDN